MNHSYRLVWNDTARRHVPAPETARGRGKSRAALTRIALLLGALLAPAAQAQALPTGGQVVSGQARISQDGARMTIDQASPKAIVHWQGFDIGSGSRVQFNQPDASAVTLNRVVAGSASRIDGQLGANGQVWLVNPNGVVFGQGSQVNVGGLVASTLDIANADFQAGKQLFTRGAAQGGITNQGHITVADGGTLALLAPTVKNEGALSARLGHVVLAGGDQVTLQAGVGGRLHVAVGPATVRTLIENRQLIVADGGQVVMTAHATDALSASVVSNAGTLQARTLQNRQGRILLLGDMRHAQVANSGLLDASAPAGGDGGRVATSAAQLRIGTGARTTTAAPRGATGHWQGEVTTDLVIHAGNVPTPEAASGIAADALTASLAGTHVDLHAYAPLGEKRHIQVDAPLRHDRHRLSLNADHDIGIHARVSVEGTGTLQLNYGATSGSTDSPPVAGTHLHVAPGRGQVDFARVGDGLLAINGHAHTVIHSLRIRRVGQDGVGLVGANLEQPKGKSS